MDKERALGSSECCHSKDVKKMRAIAESSDHNYLTNEGGAYHFHLSLKVGSPTSSPEAQVYFDRQEIVFVSPLVDSGVGLRKLVAAYKEEGLGEFTIRRLYDDTMSKLDEISNLIAIMEA